MRGSNEAWAEVTSRFRGHVVGVTAGGRVGDWNEARAAKGREEKRYGKKCTFFKGLQLMLELANVVTGERGEW